MSWWFHLTSDSWSEFANKWHWLLFGDSHHLQCCAWTGSCCCGSKVWAL